MKRGLAVVAAFVLLALTGPAVAQDADQTSGTVTGTIAIAADEKIVITTEGGEEQTYLVDPQTALPSEELAAGTRVSVRYEQVEGSGTLARTVTVLESDPETDAAAGEEQPESLPQTASPVPLMMLVGLTGLAGGLAVRSASRRM